MTLTASTTPDAPVVGGGSGAPLPALASGIELFGEYEAGGFIEPKYLLRRADGQVVQLPWLLYLVACELDGRSDAEQVAERVSARAGREVSPANVTFLAEQRLAPLGVLEPRPGEVARMPKGSHLFALGLRAALLPAGVIRVITRPFLGLFHPVVVVGALVGLVVLDGWLFLGRGFGSEMVDVLTDPVLVAALGVFQLFSGLFHELGHSTACRYGGASPGKVGAGIYLVWPVFYSDVTDSYRLSRRGRLRTDLGGVYFNVLLVLLLAGAYVATGFEPLLVAIAVEQFRILQQFLPFLRLDGYYLMSDLIGVPDLFSRIGPILRSLRPGATPEPAVAELKPRVRPIVTLWVLASVVAISAFLVGVAVNAPSWVARASAIFSGRIDDAGASLAEGNLLGAAFSVIRAGLAFIPVIGITWVVVRMALRRRRKALKRLRHGAGAESTATTPPRGRSARGSTGKAVAITRGPDGRPKKITLTPEQLQEFPLKVRWRGYDQKQVRTLLGAVARRYSASARQADGAPAPGMGVESDDLLESVVATELLREAAEHAEQVRREAEDKAIAQLDIARQIFEEAAAEAAAIRARADDEAADLVVAARRQLDVALELKLKARKELEGIATPSPRARPSGSGKREPTPVAADRLPTS